MMKIVATLAALVGVTVAESSYNCADDYAGGGQPTVNTAGDPAATHTAAQTAACVAAGSPGFKALSSLSLVCGCSNGAVAGVTADTTATPPVAAVTAVVAPSEPCTDSGAASICCHLPTCTSTNFVNGLCTGRQQPITASVTGVENGVGVACTMNAAGDGFVDAATSGVAGAAEDGYNTTIVDCVFKSAAENQAAKVCSWVDGVAVCTEADCCEANASPVDHCIGSWTLCDSTSSTTCAATRTWTTTRAAANGGNACPTDPPDCFNEAASAATCTGTATTTVACAGANSTLCQANAGCVFRGAYDGTCEDTCDASLCLANDNKLAPWALAASCTGMATDGAACTGATENLCTAAGADCVFRAAADCDGDCTARDCCTPNECKAAARCVEMNTATCSLNTERTACISAGTAATCTGMASDTVTQCTGTDSSACTAAGTACIFTDTIQPATVAAEDSEDCIFQNSEDSISTTGYFAKNPEATTVRGLNSIGCSTGKLTVGTASDGNLGTTSGGFMGMPYNTQVRCPADDGEFQWTGCTAATDCDGAAGRTAQAATCVAKGLVPTCSAAAAVPDTVCAVAEDGATCEPDAGCIYNAQAAGRQLPADIVLCGAVTAADNSLGAEACEAVYTDADAKTVAGVLEWDAGVCDGTPCRSMVDAACTLKPNWDPTTCPDAPCVFGKDTAGVDIISRLSCPIACDFTPQTGQACTYTAAIKSDKIDMNALGANVLDTTGKTSCAALNPEGKLKHFEACQVTCDAGYHFVESKRDSHKIRITNPKYWRPLQPRCDDGILHYTVECEKDTDWTGVLIIALVLGFFLILIPVVKYMQVVGAYNKDKAAGCTWAPDGTKTDPSGGSAADEAAD